MSNRVGWLFTVVAIARAILHDRAARRRMLAQSLIVALAFMVLGLWVVDGWLKETVIRFLLWWTGCALATLWVLAFAVYDVLAVVREERKKAFEDNSRADSPCDD